ncbi:hypothetical protein DL96DRAFT_1629709 [Flagelloscypha sp. PMI_526]|nr:hypothetical protein DL96DRAFT_1629709 [Flagelloscypha sp. PMI_526]
MVSFTSLILALAAATDAFSLPADVIEATAHIHYPRSTANSSGFTADGWYYTWRTDGADFTALFALGNNGNYNVT